MISGSLKTSSEDKDESTDHDGPFSSEMITGVTSEHGAKEGTACKHRDYRASMRLLALFE